MTLCSVVFGVTLRLLVINTSLSSPVNNKRRRLPAMSVTNLSCHGPAILCVLHLAVESLTTRSGARYWRRIVMFAYSTCVRRPRQGGGFPSEYCYNVWYMEMLEWSRVWIPNGEKILKLIRFDRIHERDRQTDRRTERQTPYDGISIAAAKSDRCH